MMQPIKVIVISNNEKSRKIIRKNLLALDDKIPYLINFSNEFEKTENFCSYDICIFHNESTNIEDTKESIEYIKEEECESKIFIISNMRDLNVLNTLISIKADGYVDSKDYKFDAIYKAINSILSFREKADNVERKIDLLEKITSLSL